ncbi:MULTISPECIES: hypothetical protein [Sorangium]|uniref:Uncharacterized protein n=1 Tax=Sorangium cellulosum TaxID=56 RepID=A0A4P2QVP9_SORCE|nr:MULTISPECIES: hypothetical protein [Sorangium]AUX34510.1 uncharacterized protein SOCE836_066840 [Sorangium cellulosum]WCQ93824.1 hypothetical protein NQZ70_06580 [Sorangium sp. Soce836]
MEQVHLRIARPRAAAARRRVVAWALGLAAAAPALSVAAEPPAPPAAAAPSVTAEPPAPPAAAAPSVAAEPPAPPAAAAPSVAAEPPAPPAAPASTPAPAPAVAPAVAGVPPGATWEETAAAHEARIAALEGQARRVHEIGSADERRAEQRRIELELAAARAAFRDFEERTTEWNSPVMVISGLVLTTLGGAAILSGAVLVFASHDDSSAARAEASEVAIATALGGVAGVAVGLPLYVFGKRRVRRDDAPSAPAVARLLVGPGAVAASPGAGPLSAGLRVAF